MPTPDDRIMPLTTQFLRHHAKQPTLRDDAATLTDALTHLFYPDEPMFGFQQVAEASAALMRLRIAAGVGPDADA